MRPHSHCVTIDVWSTPNHARDNYMYVSIKVLSSLQGKVLKEWKPRKFVLKEKSTHLHFYRGSKVSFTHTIIGLP